MKTAASLLRILAVLLLMTATLHASAPQSCTPDFPFKDGWWGADAAYSIPLQDDRVVWIFGDTLYGEKRVVEGQHPRMVRNSIGISTCEKGKWDIEYVIRGMKDGKPQDFFPPRDSGYWYWALDGFRHEDTLWITLLCVRDKAGTGSEVFGFETCGTDLAKITGLSQHPEAWKVEYFSLVPDGKRAYPSAAAVIEGEHAYIFGLYEQGNRPLLVSRIPLSGLEQPARKLQYLAKDGSWKPGFEPTNAKQVMHEGATELSVRYHGGLGKWLAVMNHPKLPSDKVLVRLAPILTGPWTKGTVIYRIPEMKPGHAGYDPDNFCYAAKEHPEFREPDSILFTYVCNTAKVKKLEQNLHIYFPRVVRIRLASLEEE